MAKAKYQLVKAGDVLGGKYRVERIIGEGGIGIVVAAKHIELRQRVAVKLLHEETLKDKDQVERFMREARAAVQLKSEHVAKVTDVGRLQNGAPFMVMELLEGEDLGDALTRGPLQVYDAIDFILQACEAIAEAHALGIVHRDLKPRNLFVIRQVHGRPFVKVLDFGLAKSVNNFGSKALTSAGMVMGSPQYMSPEQMKASRDVDFRTDIWSLGICLYELLAGVAPYDAETTAEMFALVITAAPPKPLPQIRPDVPEGLWKIVLKCLQKKREDRFTNVSELATALEIFGSPASRGSAQKISAVFFAAPRLGDDDIVSQSAPDTIGPRTFASFGADSTQRGTSGLLLIAGGGVLAVLAMIGLVGALVLRRGGRDASQPVDVETVMADAGEVSPASAAPPALSEPFVVTLPAPVASTPLALRSASATASDRPPQTPGSPPKRPNFPAVNTDPGKRY